MAIRIVTNYFVLYKLTTWELITKRTPRRGF